MPDFLLKAAVAHYEQLEDRAQYCVAMGQPVQLELHTFGSRDIDDAVGLEKAQANVGRLRSEFPVARLVVHIPPQSVPDVIVREFDADQCRRTLDFAHQIAAEGVVLHRYFGLVLGAAPPRGGDKTEAAAAFNDIVAGLARAYRDLLLFVENVGHYSLLPRDGRNYLRGPLDHFFPWEIEQFRTFVAGEGLTNLIPFVDVAHATLSANLFNRRRARPRQNANDPRFTWVTDEDLNHRDWLEPLDFIDARMAYLHVSDALRLDPAQCGDPGLAEATLTRSLVSEGLEIGEGNLPFGTLPTRFGAAGALVVEVDPAYGESQARNGAQRRSYDRLRSAFGLA